ncbi:MAG: hypothetical protein WBP22_00925 [Candidatus Saccharimonas sp.]
MSADQELASTGVGVGFFATIGGILLAIGSALMACTRAGAKRRQGYVGK